MNYKLLTQFAASEYSCGAYGAGNYNENACTTSTGNGSTGGGTATGGGTGLANTGMDMLLLLAVGVVLVIGSVIYLVRSLRKARRIKKVVK